MTISESAIYPPNMGKDAVLSHPIFNENMIYHDVNEDATIKLRLIHNLAEGNISENTVFTIIGGGWTRFYLENGASKVYGVDVNTHQIQEEIKKIEENPIALQAFNNQNLHLYLGDMEDITPFLQQISESKIIDLTNILDYFIQKDKLDYIEELLAHMHTGAVLVMSATIPINLMRILDHFSAEGYPVDHSFEQTNSGLISNFVCIRKT